MPLDVHYRGKGEVAFPLLYFEPEKHPISCPLFNGEADSATSWKGAFFIFLLENNRFFSPPCGCMLKTEAGLKDPVGVLI